MFLGSVEFDDETNHGLKATSLVLSFNPVARCVVDKPASFFVSGKTHYEPSDETIIVVSGELSIGGYGGDLTRSIRVPFSYDDVKQLLAAGVKKGETVDFTKANTENLRASLKQQPPQPPKKLNL
ncbi:MAG: hypothetical protein ACAH80_03745 [Alphaproteobacteria bacterium]